MAAQNGLDLSLWQRFKSEHLEDQQLMGEIETACFQIAEIPFEEIEERGQDFQEFAWKVELLPEGVRPTELGSYALFMWATVMAKRLRTN